MGDYMFFLVLLLGVFVPVDKPIINDNINIKYVALTFDDGPSKYTKSIIETLNKYDSKGTFFVLGNKVNIYEKTVINMYYSGHEIGNHSFSHAWLTKLDDYTLSSEINKTQTKIFELTNYYPILLRPTYGSINKRLRNFTNLKIIMWDVDSNDWKIKNYKTILNRVLNNIDDGDIILFHDTYKRTNEVIKELVPILIQNNFRLVTVSQLESLKNERR